MAKNLPSKIKYTSTYPTSIIVNGLDKFGYEIAKTLSEQGGYVIIIDDLDKSGLEQEDFSQLQNTSVVDFLGLEELIREIRRVDYIFYLNHNLLEYEYKLTSQEFLAASSYLNQLLTLAVEFESLFLLTNSIRAHKLLLQSSQDSVNKDTTDYLNYSQAEFVRYSENLVLEFKRTKNLEVKVLRLGELLGEGIDLAKDTNIGKLVYQAVTKQNLYLDQDGLSSEYYVHLIDAVYAVIKAQFSRNLPEDVYTVAYPEPVTQLSLAYKLQEIEPEAGEIKFLDDEDSKVNLRIPIYKASPNLITIGWHPKIDFSTSLAQSVAYVRKILEIYTDSDKKTTNEDDILTDGFDEEQQIQNGALARLIAERRRNESLQQAKYNKGVEIITAKKHSPTFWMRVQRWVGKNVNKLKRNFAFLSNLTLRDFLIYTLLTSLFLLLFFTLLAPIISIARDAYQLQLAMDKAIEAKSSNNWQEMQEELTVALSNIDGLRDTVSGSQILFFVSRQEELQERALSILQSLSFYTESLRTYAATSASLQNYYTSFTPDLVYRPTNSSVLSLNSANTSVTQESISTLSSANETALRILQTANRVYSQIDTSNLPSFIKTYVDNLFTEVPGITEDYVETGNILSIFANINAEKYVIAVIVQDNTRSTYSGGKISSIGVLEFSRGKLIDIQFLPIQNVDLRVTDYTPAELNEIQQLSGIQNLNNSNLEPIVALDNVVSEAKFESLVKRVAATTFSENIDTILSFNTLGFQGLLSTYGNLEINNQELNSSNYLSRLNLLQTDNPGSRNLLITNIAAVLFDRFLTTEEPLLSKVALVNKLYDQGSIGVDAELARKLDITVEQADVKIAVRQPDGLQATTNPGVDLNMITRISAELVQNTLEINIANADSAERVLVCLDKSATNFDFQDLDPSIYSSVILDDYNCTLFDVTRVKTLDFSYNSRSDAEYKQRIVVAGNLGLRYDLQIDFPARYTLTAATPLPGRQANSVFYSGEVYNHVSLNLIFNINGN